MTTVVSIRARCMPRHMWGPCANARCGMAGRKMSKTSGLSQRVSSWLAEPMQVDTLPPSGMVTPAISTSLVAVRLIWSSGGSKRSPSSMAWGRRERSSRTAVELVGMGEQQEEQVARRAVGGLRPGRQQEAQERVDGLVVEAARRRSRRWTRSLITSSRGSCAAVGHDRREVVAQALGGEQAPLDVGAEADELDRPALELGEVLLGQPEQARDHPHGEARR